MNLETRLEYSIDKELLSKVVFMYDENFSPHVRIPHYKLRKRLKTKTYELISLRLNNEMIGFSLVSLNPFLSTIFIDYLCIDKKVQKGGYGKFLLNALHSDIYFPGFKYCILECEDYLVSYYQKNKFIKIPRKYPLENSKPLYMLYRKRGSETIQEPHMYQKFILYGLLFNGEITIHYDLLRMLYEFIFECYRTYLSLIIMNYKSTHT
jgi:hypothetical protein